MTEKPKPKAMFKCEGGFIMTKRQMKTANNDIWWQFSKSPGDGGSLLSTAEIFEDHGYEVVPWDDAVIASDGSATFDRGM